MKTTFNPSVLLYGDDRHLVSEVNQKVNNFYELTEVSYESELFLSKEEALSTIIFILQSSNGDAGLHKLSEIRASYPDLPIVLLLVAPKQEEIIQIFRAGASDILTLPMASDVLVRCLHKYAQQLEMKKAEEQLMPLWLFKLMKLANTFKKKLTVSYLPVEKRYEKPKSQLSCMIPLQMSVPSDLNGSADVKVCFLGTFSISIKGKSCISLKLGKKDKALLMYLLYGNKRFFHREKLMDIFWPDSNPSGARNCLNGAIFNIRKALQKLDKTQEFIIFKDESYGINPDLMIELDIDEFSRHWNRGQNIERTQVEKETSMEIYQNAIALYKGDFLQDVSFVEWIEVIRENLKETYLAMLGRLSAYKFDQKYYSQTISLCKKMLQKDNCLEEAHRRLMFSFYKLEMRDKAIRQFEKCKRILKEELNVPPSKRTMELYQEIIL